MTRIAIMSDLHIEFDPPRYVTTDWSDLDAARSALPGHPDRGPLLDSIRGEVDLVLMAGDVDVTARAALYAQEVATYVDARRCSSWETTSPIAATSIS